MMSYPLFGLIFYRLSGNVSFCSVGTNYQEDISHFVEPDENSQSAKQQRLFYSVLVVYACTFVKLCDVQW